MPIEITMPSLAAGMQAGVLVKWLKVAGDAVTAGDVIAEIEADKAALEVESPEDGTIGALLVGEGEEVPVAKPIALILRIGEAAIAVPEKVTYSPTPSPSTPAAASAIPAVPQRQQGTRSSPLARRLARDGGLSLADIAGTGPHGRIIRRDVELRLSRPSAPRSPQEPIEAERVPLTGVRKTIARRLELSKQTIPHFYLTVDCIVDRTVSARHEINSRLGDDGKLSLNDFVIKAVAAALRAMPEVNRQWAGDSIAVLGSVDVSVAVATPTGLITPIIRDADKKGLVQISNEMRDLARRARDGRLQPSEYQGGSFSISNLGMYGIREFAAIINPPQSGILAVGEASRRAIVTGDEIRAATCMTCTLSADHRVVDGALGAQFLAAVKRFIEEPLNLLV